PVGWRVFVFLDDFEVEFFSRTLEANGDRFAEIGLDGEQEDRLCLEHVADQFCAGASLHLAHAADTEDVVAGLSDIRLQRDSDDIGNMRLLEHWRSRLGRRRETGRNDGNNLVADQLVGDRNGLVRLALVVVGDQLYRPPIDTAGLVHLFDGHLYGDL